MLDDAGIAYRAAEAVIDDGGLEPGGVDPAGWVAALAYLKARSVASDHGFGEDVVVLGADTVCSDGGRLLGKPADEDEALAMLLSFVGRSHRVLTGVALVGNDGRRELFSDAATVRWPDLSESELRGYIASGRWRGKAGGYSLAERHADGWDIAVEGDPDTVMGLPMRRLPARLRVWGIEAAAAGTEPAV